MKSAQREVKCSLPTDTSRQRGGKVEERREGEIPFPNSQQGCEGRDKLKEPPGEESSGLRAGRHGGRSESVCVCVMEVLKTEQTK